MRGIILKTVPVLLLCTVTLSLLVTAGHPQTWWFGKNKVQYKDFQWNILKTPHFDIHFNNGNRDLAARTAVILEYGYNKLSNDFSHNISWRIPVIVYGSHSDFQQTNVTWGLLPEGVQAFAEPMRKRIVLHFSGSNADFTHTTIHELVHIFQFDIIYGSLLRSVFSRNLLFQIPLWFAEGCAEYYSTGFDEEAEMFMRDATVFDYLSTNLDYASGYMVYKAGQATITYINLTYGPEKVIEIMDNLHYQRSMELALKSTIGITTAELSKEWNKSMRRKYWPLYADKKEPEYYGRRLTDHMKNHHYMNSKPALSPDGDYIVFYSDRKGLDAIYLMNAVTGKVEKKLLQALMSTRFESIRSMRSRLTYSPDGENIAFVAKSGGREKLFILGVPGGKIGEEIELPLDFFYSPSWSPDGDRLALVGTENGQTDLYIYHRTEKSLRQITDDVEDEKDPAWFPDGSAVVYSRFPISAIQPFFEPDSSGVDRISDVDFQSMDNVTSVKGDIWIVDVASGEKKQLIATPGNDSAPLVLSNGGEIIFVSDESGVSNLYLGSLEVGSYRRFTDVLGGVFTPAYSEEKDRLVYTAFSYAGYDLFIMDSFTNKSKVSYSTGGPELEAYLTSTPGPAEQTGEDREVPGETIDAPSDSLQGPGVVAGGIESFEDLEKDLEISGKVEAVIIGDRPSDSREAGIVEGEVGPPLIVVDEDSEEDVHPDTLEAIRERMKKKVGTIQPYEIKFSPDYVGNGMGLFFSTGFGFGLVNQVAFSDLLGDHHLFLAFNIYRSLEDSDLMISYYYLKKRIDYAVGVFQFKNYLNSRFSSVGEAFLDYRYFTERNYGIFGLASFPFSTFTRFDLEFQGFVSEREFFDYFIEDASGAVTFVPGGVSRKRLFQPTLSIVHDSAYFGSFGPVIGSRWLLSVSRALSFSGSDVSRTTAFFDYRKYFPLFWRNYLALRGIGAVSTGDEPRLFFLGGPLTMRGYDYLQFSGSRMLLFNLEYRYPLIDALIFGWPGRWGISNIGGTLFLDSGAVWGEGRFIEKVPNGIKPRVVNDLEFYSDFGIGFYMRFGFLILNFQLGWPTDFSRTGDPFFHFYLGPMF
jgi:Tol biopolymer transport system component